MVEFSSAEECALGGAPPFVVFEKWGSSQMRVLTAALPLRLAAGHLLDLRLLRSPRIIAWLQRLFRLAFLARGAFYFLAFVST